VIKIKQFWGYVKVSVEFFGFQTTRELKPTVETMGHLNDHERARTNFPEL
jgi:hypothetical protein